MTQPDRIDIPLAPDLPQAELRRLFDAVNRGVEGGARRVRLIPENLKSVVKLAHFVRDLARTHAGLSIEMVDPGGLAENAKLKGALELAGLSAIVSTDANAAPVRQDAAYLVAHPELLPQDYLTFNTRMMAGVPVREALIRPTYRCNSKCHFCWLSQKTDAPQPERSREIIQALGVAGWRHLVISGGEPTLLPELPELIRAAKNAGFEGVTLQSNGVLLSQRTRVDDLARAGLDEVFLALHAHNAELSDAVTGLPGAFEKTRQGLRHLLASEIQVVVDCVITRQTAPHLPAFADFLLAEAARANRAFTLNVAVAQPMGIYAPGFQDHTPRLSLLRQPLIAALERLYKSPVGFAGFTSACGPPLCAVEGRSELLGELTPVGADADHVKPPACACCRLSEYCLGLRRAYAEAFGVDEVLPIE